MRTSMRKPCEECPFALADGLNLGAARRAEIAQVLLGDGWFPCHMTIEYDDDSEDGEGHAGPDSQHCAGAMALLEKEDRPNQLMRISGRLGLYTEAQADELRALELPYRSLWDWVGHAQSER